MAVSENTEALLRKLEMSTHPKVLENLKAKLQPGTGQMKEHEHPRWQQTKKSKD